MILQNTSIMSKVVFSPPLMEIVSKKERSHRFGFNTNTSNTSQINKLCALKNDNLKCEKYTRTAERENSCFKNVDRQTKNFEGPYLETKNNQTILDDNSLLMSNFRFLTEPVPDFTSQHEITNPNKSNSASIIRKKQFQSLISNYFKPNDSEMNLNKVDSTDKENDQIPAGVLKPLKRKLTNSSSEELCHQVKLAKKNLDTDDGKCKTTESNTLKPIKDNECELFSNYVYKVNTVQQNNLKRIQKGTDESQPTSKLKRKTLLRSSSITENNNFNKLSAASNIVRKSARLNKKVPQDISSRIISKDPKVLFAVALGLMPISFSKSLESKNELSCISLSQNKDKVNSSFIDKNLDLNTLSPNPLNIKSKELRVVIRNDSTLLKQCAKDITTFKENNCININETVKDKTMYLKSNKKNSKSKKVSKMRNNNIVSVFNRLEEENLFDHNNTENLLLVSKTSSVYICNFCELMCSSTTELVSHERIHLTCKICKRKFKNLSSSLLHSRENCIRNSISDLSDTDEDDYNDFKKNNKSDINVKEKILEIICISDDEDCLEVKLTNLPKKKTKTSVLLGTRHLHSEIEREQYTNIIFKD